MKLIYAYHNAGEFNLAQLKVDVLKSIWRCLKGCTPKKWPNKTELILQLQDAWSSAVEQNSIQENERECNQEDTRENLLPEIVDANWEEIGGDSSDDNSEESD